MNLATRSILPTGTSENFVNYALLERNQAVEKTLDVKIEMVPCQPEKTAVILSNLMISGLHTYDVVGAYQYYDLGLSIGENSGFFINYENPQLKKDIHINPNAPYWDGKLYDLMTVYGNVNWITGELTQTWISSLYVSYINCELWQANAELIAACTTAKGISDPFELVQNGLWTIDLWTEISKAIWKDQDSSQTVDEDDIVGFMSYEPGKFNFMADALAVGSGVTYSTLHPSGVYVDQFDTLHNRQFSEKLASLYSLSSHVLQLSEDSPVKPIQQFTGGRVLMTIAPMYESEFVHTQMDAYYILPLPKLLKGSSTGYTTTHCDNLTLFGIPTSTVKEGKLAAITSTMEMLAAKSAENVTFQYYACGLQTRFNKATADNFAKQAKMLDTIRGSVTHDFMHLYSHEIDQRTSNTTSPAHFFRSYCGSTAGVHQLRTHNSDWSQALKKLLNDMQLPY